MAALPGRIVSLDEMFGTQPTPRIQIKGVPRKNAVALGERMEAGETVIRYCHHVLNREEFQKFMDDPGGKMPYGCLVFFV